MAFKAKVLQLLPIVNVNVNVKLEEYLQNVKVLFCSQAAMTQDDKLLKAASKSPLPPSLIFLTHCLPLRVPQNKEF